MGSGGGGGGGGGSEHFLSSQGHCVWEVLIHPVLLSAGLRLGLGEPLLTCQLPSLGGQVTPDSRQTPEDSQVDSEGARNPSPGGLTCQPQWSRLCPFLKRHRPTHHMTPPAPPSSGYHFLSGLAALGFLHPLCMCLICSLCESLSVSPPPAQEQSREQRPGASDLGP